MSDKNPIYVVQHNHFDPVWRRCWNRTFDYKGKRYRSYADVEERVIDVWMENAKNGAVWSEGQAVVFRKYLERNPERLDEMRDHVKRGVIELTMAGEVVPDTNMPSGETLLRNLMMGMLYFEDTFGVVPNIGWLEDAFGQSAQMPQLFRGVGCDRILNLSYKRVPGIYWRGLDGSVVFTGADLFGTEKLHVQPVFPFYKLPPCPMCSGMGCERCDGHGFDSGKALITDQLLIAAFAAEYHGDPINLVIVGGEEAIPNPNLPGLLQEARQEHGIDLRFGGYGVISQAFAEHIARVDNPDIEVSEQMETNPVWSGCFVTRIKIKQRMRFLENMLDATERWATVAHLMGAEYPSGCLTKAWRNVIFCAFHDAITSSHLDAAYFELLDIMDEAEHEAGHILDDALNHIEEQIGYDEDKGYLLLYNSDSWERNDPISVILSGTEGRPVLKDSSGSDLEVYDVSAEGQNVKVTFQPPKVPALGYSAVEVIADSEPIHPGDTTTGPGEIENEFFKIKVSDKGITSIFDKSLGKEVMDTGRYLANELILEEDIGHPWSTSQPPSFEEGLAQYTSSVSIRRAMGMSEVSIMGHYRGEDENVRALSWRQSIRIYKCVDRIDFKTEIEWDSAQRRIRIAFPTSIDTDEAIYSIPYGAIKRGKYEAEEYDGLLMNNGDWPAINWVDVYDTQDNWGVALLNTGTPSHKVLDGTVFLSILRSPADSWVLNEPEYYDCPDFDGARDAGSHEFRYSLIPHAGDYRDAGIEKRGRELNNPLIIRGLTQSGTGKLGLEQSFMKIKATDNVIVATIKKAEKDDSVILRLAETGGIPGEASIAVAGAGNKTVLVNYLERNPEPVSGSVKLGPFKVATLKYYEK